MTLFEKHPRWRIASGLLTGVFLGLLLTEVGLRFVVTPGIAKHPKTEYTVRQYKEGVATAHFAPDGRRLTGGRLLPNSDNILLVGDSFVYGVNVNDEETMGSRLENRLRSNNRPVNVVQYGLGGVSVPEYTAVASRLLHQWNPARVIIFLNRSDLGTDSIRDNPMSEYRMTIDGHGNWKVLHEPKRRENPGLGSMRETLAEKSSLLNALYARYIDMRHYVTIDLPWATNKKSTRQASPDPRLPAIPRAAVQALRRAFPGPLLIAFDTDSTGGERDPDPERETRFLQACRDEGVDCICLARKIREGENRLRRYARGFYNSAPNIGHYNANGHALVADAFYDALLASGLDGH